MADRIPFPDEGITDGTLRVRKHRETDIGLMVKACRDPSIPRYTAVPDDYTEQDAREWIESAASGRAEGTRCSLLIAGATDDVLLGSIGLHDFDWQDMRAETGYWVAPWARGRGVAIAAVNLITAWGFGELGLARISITAETQNDASIRVAEAAGFTRDGVLRQWKVQGGERRDMVMLGRLPSDPPARLGE